MSSRRHSYSTCISFGTDGEADYSEMDVTVSFTVAWGSEPSGMFGPPENYDPGSANEIEDLRVDLIDGKPPTLGPVYIAMILDEVERVSTEDMLIVAGVEAADGRVAAEDYRAEQMREDRREQSR